VTSAFTKASEQQVGGDPARTPFAVEGVVAQGISEASQRSRGKLLNGLNTLGRALRGDAKSEDAA
jgi:hypothetical protein